MPTLHPYLGFDGTCAEAMRFYAKTLGAELQALLTHADTPGGNPMGPEYADRVMHAHLVHKDFEFMAGDSPVGQHAAMRGFMLTLTYESTAEARRIFDALAAGGQITMPAGETFWAEFFGMCVDRYGTPWAVNGGSKSMG
jgi:PhnB protein